MFSKKTNNNTKQGGDQVAAEVGPTANLPKIESNGLQPVDNRKSESGVAPSLHVSNSDFRDPKRLRNIEDRLVDDLVLVEQGKLFRRSTKEPSNGGSNVIQGAIDFTAGSLGGMMQVYVSQPLDTVKVKQQTFPKLYRNMFHCFVHTYRTDGIYHGLYAGSIPAVIANVAENSVLFAAYGGCQKLVAYGMGIEDTKDLPTLGNAFAGFLAAFFSTFTLCPTELVKCKLQALREMKQFAPKDGKALPVTPWKLSKHIFETEGIPGFFRGLSSTFMREMPGYFFFFGGYEGTRELLTKPGQSKDDIGALKTMVAGAVGGVTLWTCVFPADVIKSRIQVNNLKRSMTSVGLEIIRKEGVLALYNGLLPSVLRTIPATATLFVVYEYTKKALTGLM